MSQTRAERLAAEATLAQPKTPKELIWQSLKEGLLVAIIATVFVIGYGIIWEFPSAETFCGIIGLGFVIGAIVRWIAKTVEAVGPAVSTNWKPTMVIVATICGLVIAFTGMGDRYTGWAMFALGSIVFLFYTGLFYLLLHELKRAIFGPERGWAIAFLVVFFLAAAIAFAWNPHVRLGWAEELNTTAPGDATSWIAFSVGTEWSRNAVDVMIAILIGSLIATAIVGVVGCLLALLTWLAPRTFGNIAGLFRGAFDKHASTVEPFEKRLKLYLMFMAPVVAAIALHAIWPQDEAPVLYWVLSVLALGLGVVFLLMETAVITVCFKYITDPAKKRSRRWMIVGGVLVATSTAGLTVSDLYSITSSTERFAQARNELEISQGQALTALGACPRELILDAEDDETRQGLQASFDIMQDGVSVVRSAETWDDLKAGAEVFKSGARVFASDCLDLGQEDAIDRVAPPVKKSPVSQLIYDFFGAGEIHAGGAIVGAAVAFVADFSVVIFALVALGWRNIHRRRREDEDEDEFESALGGTPGKVVLTDTQARTCTVSLNGGLAAFDKGDGLEVLHPAGGIACLLEVTEVLQEGRVAKCNVIGHVMPQHDWTAMLVTPGPEHGGHDTDEFPALG